ANINRLAHGLALLSRHSAGFFANWPHPRVILYGGANIPERNDQQPQGYALFVGRLLPHKGILPLIEALAPATPLRVVGRPYDPAYLERLREAAVGKNVRFILDADDSALGLQYRGASVVLQPSIPVNQGAHDTAELLGLVTLEGMAHGKPVIVTRTASLPELVVHGETGFIVEPGDREGLRSSLELLMDDAELSQRMGDAARRHVQANFSWNRVAASGLEFYQRLRGHPAATRSADRVAGL
ncbi:MAG: glycosyltransferase family 4 protein, partial [Gemmatimonadota bacterium]|nr:glycosyltransferase family 4 protein [Gemmatimonadota bacterium]